MYVDADDRVEKGAWTTSKSATSLISTAGPHRSVGAARDRIGLAPLVFLPGAGRELYRGVGAIVLFGLQFATTVTLVFLSALLIEVLNLRIRRQAASQGGYARTQS